MFRFKTGWLTVSAARTGHRSARLGCYLWQELMLPQGIQSCPEKRKPVRCATKVVPLPVAAVVADTCHVTGGTINTPSLRFSKSAHSRPE
jgi:hypothetical protein